ncbi:DNA polymerase III subunit chi [Roseivivax jejudonensis]|uniref:DNA polymerase III subunit chi n=1 Tax=Roseivivax jejudonensis TaxID=1529041 RepID=A0A1X6YS42_9RHOB|nr:DNA polymerase III subunit chi [Roseivivax jejudonensis]SLN29793.1 DNA polymerase III subunit chi [Roseivivax jejudonensis]
MGAALFYHLTRRPLDTALAQLLDKALGAGHRIAVRGTDRDRLAALDAALWAGDEDGFLPHGLAGGPHDTAQPVLLTDAVETPNGATCLMSVDGATVTAAEVGAFARVCVLFDGADTAATQAARVQWKGLTDAGCAAQYWSEESGRWEMKAESAGR